MTLVLTISAITNLANPNNLLTLALFLPVPIYFLYLTYLKLHKWLKYLFNLEQAPQAFFGPFSIKEFFVQSSWDFLVSLILFSVAAALIMYKLSLQILG